MFGKLFKYEFKNFGKLGVPIFLGIFALGLFAGLSVFGLQWSVMQDEEINMLFDMLLLFFLLFAFLGVAVGNAVIALLLLWRYYKSTATQEAYLTFTLPVSARALIFSKLLNALLWLIFAAIVSCLAFALGVAVYWGSCYLWMGVDIFEKAQLWEIISDLVQEFSNAFEILLEGFGFGGGVIWLTLASAILSPVMSLTLCFAVITFAASAVRKNKLLVALLLYFAINFAIGTAQNLIHGAFTLLSMQTKEDYFGFIGAAIVLLIQIGVLLGSFFLTQHSMEKKLNLL